MTEKAVRSTQAAEDVGRLIRAFYAHGRERVAQDGRIAWVMGGVPPELLLAMDIQLASPENYGTVCAAKQVAAEFIDSAESDGFAHDICSYLRVGLGYARKMHACGGVPPGAPFGGMPAPSMFLAPSRRCDPRVKFFEAMRRYFDVPTYIFDFLHPLLDDAGCRDRKANAHYVEYNLEGLRGLLAFLEREVGTKLDKERLEHAVTNSLEVWRLLYEVHEMRKVIPCPMGSEDAFATVFPFLWMAGEDEAVEFYRRLHNEITGRVRNRVGIIPQEKYRLLWIGLPPFFDMGLFNYLERHGAVSVEETVYYPTEPIEVDRSDPLKALVEKNFWGYDMGGSDGMEIRCGVLGGSQVLQFARDYQVDGAIIHCIRSCRNISLGSKHMSRLLKEKLGLPSLYIEADMADPRDYSHVQVRADIDDFIELLEARKANA